MVQPIRATPPIPAQWLWLPLYITLEQMLNGTMPTEDQWNLVCYQARLSDAWYNSFPESIEEPVVERREYVPEYSMRESYLEPCPENWKGLER